MPATPSQSTLPSQLVLEKSELVGTWELRSHTTYRGGSRSPTGANPRGLITYTADGMMMVGITFDEGRIDLRRNIFYPAFITSG